MKNDSSDSHFIKIGITGHRNLGGADMGRLRDLLRQAIENILFVAAGKDGRETPFVAMSPMAEGADILFAKVAASFSKCHLKVVLPFEKEEYRKDFTNKDDLHAFDTLTSPAPNRTIEILGELGSQSKEEHYLQLGKKVVDGTDYLIAIWDEKVAKGMGGTGDIVAYAQKQGKPILVINPFDPEPTIEVSYMHSNGHPNSNKINLKDGSNNEATASKFQKYLSEHLINSDNDAIKFKRKYKSLWNKAFNLGIVAVLCFSIQFAFDPPILCKVILSTAEIISIFIILYLIIREKWSKLYSRYLSGRFMVERIRIAQLYHLLGFRLPALENRPVYLPTIDKEQEKELGRLYSMVNLSTKISSEDLHSRRKTASDWVGHQYDYYHRHKKKMHKSESVILWVRAILIMFLIILMLLHTISLYFDWCKCEIHFFKVIHHWLVFLLLVLPAFIARVETLEFLNDWNAHYQQSDSMSAYLKQVKISIENAGNEENLTAIIDQLNENLLLENMDWGFAKMGRNIFPF